MNDLVYTFRVDEMKCVQSNFNQQQYVNATQGCSGIFLSMIGDQSNSIMAINEIANLFDIGEDWPYEWAYRVNQAVQPNLIFAFVYINNDNEDRVIHA